MEDVGDQRHRLDPGNCLEVVPGDTIAHVTFVAADTTTAQLDVAE